MGLRFVIGRAGSGKTHHCVEAIRQRLRADPIDGRRLILLVPEQAGLQMERSLIEPADIPGSHRAEVLSFRRLAHRVLESAGAPPKRALSDTARLMVLRHLTLTLSDRLRFYRRAERFGGFIQQLAQSITEFIQASVTPPELKAVADGLAPAAPAQEAKLHDLRLIYEAYLCYLDPDRLDPHQHLQLARDYLARCTWLQGAEMWVDGFASFTGQEALTLIELSRLCHHVDLTAMFDPSLVGDEGGISFDCASLFSKIDRCHQNLQRDMVEADIEIADPLLLDHQPPHRFRESDALADLEKALSGQPSPPRADDETASSDVRIAALPTQRLEVEYAVSQIWHWVQSESLGYRCRDVAIIARDLEPYHDLLSQALTQRGIPFFIDRRRPIAHHPLPEFLRTVVAAAEDMALEPTRVLLKTGLLPIPVLAADRMENYLLAHGISGGKAWRKEWSYRAHASFLVDSEDAQSPTDATLDEINDTRRRIMSCLHAWLDVATDSKGHRGQAWVAALIELLDVVGAEDTLEKWASDAELGGRLDQAGEHRSVWRQTVGFLEDLAYAFDEVNLSLDELSSVMEAGLSQLTLGLAPPMIDQVLVGSIQRSRHPSVKAAVVIGFNEGLFPKLPEEDSVLTDDDRRVLVEGGVDVQPPTHERILDERLLAYIAATRPSQKLLITYAAGSADGQSLRPSPYLNAILEACPGAEIEEIADPAPARRAWDVLTTPDLARRLTGEMRQRQPLAEDDPDSRVVWNELYSQSRRRLFEDASNQYAFNALAPPSKAALTADSVEKIHGGSMRTSVSQLESYAACPFKHFASRSLGLRERPVAPLAPVDVGQVHHAILEEFVGGLAEKKMRMGQLSPDELLGELSASCERVALRLPEERLRSSPRDVYILRRASSQLARVLSAQRRIATSSAARPFATELPFGMNKKGGLPAMVISTPAGHRVELRGYIDRVDLAELGDETLGIVIDYKLTREKKLDLSEVYHGLSLQLLGYLLVLAEHGHSLAGRPITPIGAFFVSLPPRCESVDHPTLETERNKATSGVARPRGLIRADRFEVLDGELAGSGWSNSFSFYQKADGTPGHLDSSDAATPSTFQAVLNRTREKLGELADDILAGDVAVRPYRLKSFSPCSWCSMGSVCRFEMGISDVRFLESMKRQEVFDRITGATVQD